MSDSQMVHFSMNWHRAIRGASLSLLLGMSITSAGAQTPSPAPTHVTVQAPNAQTLLNKVVAHYKAVKLIGLHMTPPQMDLNVMIACIDPARVGNVSSTGDLAIMETPKPVVEFKQKDAIYEVKAPLYDSKGELIGMMVELMPTTAANSEDAALKAEESLRDELQRGIPSGAWMFGSGAR